jgi:2-oxoglutarate ferredoxin oxidoreductase subunit alpha
MYDLTMHAFDLADIYRTPVMLLGDSVIGQMKEALVPNSRPVRELPAKEWAVRGKGSEEQKVVKSLFLGDGELEAHNWHLHAKYQTMKEKECLYEEFRTEDAQLLVTAFGSVSRIAHTAVAMAREAGLKVGLLRPVTLFPFPEKAVAKAAQAAGRVLVIELNTGQMVDDVRLSVGAGVEVNFYGRPPGAGSLPSPEELLEQIKKHYA